MNKQIQIKNLETMIAFWRVAILSHEQEIQKAADIIQMLEDQIEQLSTKNDLEDQNF